ADDFAIEFGDQHRRTAANGVLPPFDVTTRNHAPQGPVWNDPAIGAEPGFVMDVRDCGRILAICRTDIDQQRLHRLATISTRDSFRQYITVKSDDLDSDRAYVKEGLPRRAISGLTGKSP